MKKEYTKKQIQEAIAYWKKQLFLMEDNQQNLAEMSNLDVSAKFVKKVKDFIKYGTDLDAVSVKVVRDNKAYDVSGFMVGWPFKKVKAGKNTCCIFFTDNIPNGVKSISSLKHLLDEIKRQADEKHITKISQLVFWASCTDSCSDRYENDSAVKVDDILINGNTLIFKIFGKNKISGKYSDYISLL